MVVRTLKDPGQSFVPLSILRKNLKNSGMEAACKHERVIGVRRRCLVESSHDFTVSLVMLEEQEADRSCPAVKELGL
jgi:hypothetical protein